MNANGADGAEAIRALASERFGFSQLRPGQLGAVESILAGRDVLAVLPTGAGKSAIYELAGLLTNGPTVVVTPLIALESDQRAHVLAAGLPATVLNSSLSRKAWSAALEAAQRPDGFVVVSPEELSNLEVERLCAAPGPGCSWWTRRTWSASGVRTFAPTTCGSVPRRRRSVGPCAWR